MWPKTVADSRHSAIRRYAIAALVAAVAVVVRMALDSILGRSAPFLVFYIAVLLAASFGGFLPGLVATLLCLLGGWYFLLRPSFSFAIEDKADVLDLFVYVISAAGISLLGGRLRKSLIAAKQSESTIRALAGRLIHAEEQNAKGFLASSMTT